MASRTTVELIDDLDGKPAVETVTFGVDGHDFEIDLSAKNAKALRKAIEMYVASARRIGGRKAVVRTQVATGVDNRAVRAWAASNGIEVSTRGRIPADVIEQYRAAGN
jgi:Lsr2